jgi:hypothetical protein
MRSVRRVRPLPPKNWIDATASSAFVSIMQETMSHLPAVMT